MNETKTYKDFLSFYENEFIKSIAENEKWTVSDNQKRPIDMTALMTKGVIWGVAFDRGYNPLVSLDTLNEFLPNAANNAYNLDAEEDGYVVLDIEPKCPDVIKNALRQLPYIYGETSMSGKGLHLVFELPEDLWQKYPAIHKKIALKESHGYYEILLSHMVTFTRNEIEPPETQKDISEFRNIFETLSSTAKTTTRTKESVKITDFDVSDIPMYAKTVTVLKSQIYKKKESDFNGDMSRYEFGMASFYLNALRRLMSNEQYDNIDYSDEEKALIVYNIIIDKLDHRKKHDTTRNGMPWLLYIVTECASKTDWTRKK